MEAALLVLILIPVFLVYAVAVILIGPLLLAGRERNDLPWKHWGLDRGKDTENFKDS